MIAARVASIVSGNCSIGFLFCCYSRREDAVEGFNLEDIDPIIESIYEEYNSRTQNSEKKISEKYLDLKNKLLDSTNNFFISKLYLFVNLHYFVYFWLNF